MHQYENLPRCACVCHHRHNIPQVRLHSLHNEHNSQGNVQEKRWGVTAHRPTTFVGKCHNPESRNPSPPATRDLLHLPPPARPPLNVLPERLRHIAANTSSSVFVRICVYTCTCTHESVLRMSKYTVQKMVENNHALYVEAFNHVSPSPSLPPSLLSFV